MNNTYRAAVAIIGFSMLVVGFAGTSYAAQKKGDSDIQLGGGFFSCLGS